MTIHRHRQRGTALAYVGILVFVLSLMIGLAVDLGRAYAVRLELAMAVDAAALAAARMIPKGEEVAQEEANKIFHLNFPDEHLGVQSVSYPPPIEFAVKPSAPDEGARVITVSASATLPTTFMGIAGHEAIDVAASGQVTRRLVDMAFIIDHSGSLNAVYPQVREAANQFVDFFDPDTDRMSLVMFARDAVVADPIDIDRGFNKSSVKNHISISKPGGETATAEGLYRGWDQLRRVPENLQAGLRVVVLFTDGAPNVLSGDFRVRLSNTPSASFRPGTVAGGIHVPEFPSYQPTPKTAGLFPIVSSCCGSLISLPPCSSATPGCWISPANTPSQYSNAPLPGVPFLPIASAHGSTPPQSVGMPTSFPLYSVNVPGQRELLEGGPADAPYPSHARNVSNAARNLSERIAHDIRTDPSGHRIRIYTLGLGVQLNSSDGAPGETGSSILRRIANDPSSPDFDPSQPEGRYYFAGDATQLSDAFQQLRDQLIRITQ
jgi:Mg-chelatase subunit ChlD